MDKIWNNTDYSNPVQASNGQFLTVIDQKQFHTTTHRAVSLEATVAKTGVMDHVNSICRAGGIGITKWLLSAVKRGGQASFIIFVCFGKEKESNR